VSADGLLALGGADDDRGRDGDHDHEDAQVEGDTPVDTVGAHDLERLADDADTDRDTDAENCDRHGGSEHPFEDDFHRHVVPVVPFLVDLFDFRRNVVHEVLLGLNEQNTIITYNSIFCQVTSTSTVVNRKSYQSVMIFSAILRNDACKIRIMLLNFLVRQTL
jgi:hypothetical protein